MAHDTSADASTAAPAADGGLTLRARFHLALIAVPVALRTAVRHVLRLSKPSAYLDLRSEVIVAVVRAFSTPPSPGEEELSASTSTKPTSKSTTAKPTTPSNARSISHAQRILGRDPGIRGPIWVSRYTAPGAADAAEAAALRDAVVDVVRQLYDEGDAGLPFPEDVAWPDVVPVEAEWTGHRAGVGAAATMPAGASEAERYAALMADATAPQPTTVLYLHGGAMYLMDPATHRHVTRALARRTGGRCYSVRYRLAPRHPFPAQLLDALVSYLTLLYPPPGALHAPVAAAHVVLAGDSAGGNLCLALTRLLLALARRGTRLPWHGRRWAVPLPAGVAVNSPWIDVSNSSPAWRDDVADAADAADNSSERRRPYDGEFDYLPAMAVPGADGLDRPPCAVWPASPPRRFLYAATPLVAHPLVTLLLGDADAWRGAPPVYCCVGWERLADEICFFAVERLRRNTDAAALVFEQYEAMPHCFALVLPHLAGTRRCLDRWAAFIRRAVEQPETLRGPVAAPAATSFTLIHAKTLAETPLRPDALRPYSDEAIRAAIRARLATVEAEGPVPPRRPSAKL